METDLTKLTPDVRTLNDMKDVLADRAWTQNAENCDLYYMYRGIETDGDLRYDITVIPPFLMGSEPVKTLGHFHAVGAKEMYIILEGEAIFLFQKGKDIVEDVYTISANKGECVIIPEEYAHVTINPSSKETLKLANWINVISGFDYESVKKKGGLCYFYTSQGWVKNRNYEQVPELRYEESLKKAPDNLDFLK
ncbi:MAG: glucose-6-phosphate isomerase family protein [Candidatus Paceibacterota bacterium]